MPKHEIIGSVVCDPPVARAGESVRVTVRDPQGRPYRNGETSSITINGVPGSEQWLRWTTPGSRTVHVMASDEGSDDIETSRLEIDVVGDDGHTGSYLHVESSPERPTAARFTVVDPTQATHVAVHRGPRLTDPGRRRHARLAVGPSAQGSEPDSVDRPATEAVPATYTWRMGDGTSLTVPRDTIEHDFGPQLDPERVRQTFNVEVVAELPDRPPVVLHHTVSLLNTYGLLRRRGVLRPPVSCDRTARFENGRFSGRMWVRNPERFQLRLTKRRVEVFYPGDRDSRIVAEEVAGVSLPPGQVVEVDVEAPATSLAGAVGFAVHFAGRPAKSETRHRVRLSAYFDIVGATEALPGSPARPADRARPTWGDPGSTPRGTHLDEPPAVLGSSCSPEILPGQIPVGFVSQATPEKPWELLPGRFVNARKGDIVLSPGDNGFIGKLLRQVSPLPNYLHAGIVTGNHDEITYATASPERLRDKAAGEGIPTDGYEPHALRHRCPGAITRTVNTATEGDLIESQDDGSSHRIRSCNSDVTELIPALVVKPDPFLETPELRDKLKVIADAAAAEDVADNIANQILDVFATSRVVGDSKASDKRRDSMAASAVGPDNMLSWDGPHSTVGGLYSHAEDLMYRPEHVEEVVVHRRTWA